MSGLSLLPVALRELGPRTLLQYGVYRIGLRSGWLRLRTPRSRWGDQPLQAWVRAGNGAELQPRRPFFFDPDADLSGDLQRALHGRSTILIEQADSILQGKFALFGADPQRLGSPIPWNSPPRVAQGHIAEAHPAADLQSDLHWSAYDLDEAVDWRSIWELSRFGWIYPLARAYRLSGQARYWEGCWALLDSWRAVNPPNTGPQWISAQEAGLRILALAFAWYAFAPALRAQPDRAAAILELVAVHATRIPPTLSYARAQRNNHLLSEAVGMYTAGVLFPALRGAERWERLGSRWLRRALADQVYPDGGYIQHSINYQRMALGLGLWAFRLAEALGAPLHAESAAALERLTRALAAVADPSSGMAPRLGHDDGSDVLPLSVSIHGDQRPILQAAWRALFGEPTYPPGPWDELSLWLGLPVAKPGSGAPHGRPASAVDLPDAGLHLLRGRQTWAALRCARFRSRPAHSDQLHLDLWWNGRNLAVDPGSYRYAAATPWDNALARAAAHNGPTVAGHEPMLRAGRFLWLQWAQGRLLGRWRSASRELEVLAAEHDGYRRQGWTCRRTVVRAGDQLWLVVDEVIGVNPASLQLTWTLPDDQAELTGAQLHMKQETQSFGLRIEPKGAELGLYRAGELSGGRPVTSQHDARTMGWCSPTYASLEPAISLVARTAGKPPLRLISRWTLGDESQLTELKVEWGSPGRIPLPFSRLLWGEQEIRL